MRWESGVFLFRQLRKDGLTVKKLLASILAACMLFSVVTLSGCSKKEETTKKETTAK
jgi:hypothetical protein